MTENTCNSRLRAILTRAKFVVFKLADSFTSGIPDFAATRDGTTLWIEGKFLQVREWPDDLRWSKVVTKRDRVQLETMVRLEKEGTAFYILYVCRLGEVRIHVEQPSVVRNSVLDNTPVPLARSLTFEEVAAWLGGRE